MKHLNLTHRPLAPTLACALILSACGGSDAPPPSPTFTLNAQVVTASQEQETLPYAGIVKAANINTQGRVEDSRQVLFPYVGFESSYGPGYSRVGNARTGTTARMLARFYPNPKVIRIGTEFKVYPIAKKAGADGAHGCLKTNDAGETHWAPLTVTDRKFDTTEVEACAGGQFSFSAPSKPLEIAIDMHMTSASQLTWRFGFYVPLTKQWAFTSGYDAGLAFAEVLTLFDSASYALVNFNDAQPSALPANMTAYGGFRPANDGFGFSNLGDNSFDLFTASDIAKNFGKDTVCFLNDDECAGLNPLGYFFKNNLRLYQEMTPNGLCYGYAMASTAIHQQAYYDGKKYLSDYNPKATSAIELNYKDVRPLIANLFMSQKSKATRAYRNEVCNGLPPSKAIEIIEDRLDTYNPIAALTIYAPDPETNRLSRGHAITPWAIADEGDGIRRIYVYDNNFPGDADRYISVDTRQETWAYVTSTNPSTAEATYKGQGAFNPLCPVPLSVGVEDSEIAIQPLGTTRFVDFSGKNSQVVDAGGRISGGDLVTQTEINNIPGADLQSFLDHKALVIPISEARNALSDIDSSNVQTYLDQRYTINAMSVDENATQTFYMNQSTLLDGDVSVAYNFGAEMTDVNMSDVITFKAHPSARIVTAERLKATKARAVQLQTFVTLNTEQTGYSSTINIDATQVSQDALGFFIKDNGRDVVVFEYDPKDAAATFTVISPGAYSLETTQFNPDGTTEAYVGTN
jgi:hypothetical protein